MVMKNGHGDLCCEMKCSICNICINTYSCTCIDFQIQTIICKHVHHIALNYGETGSPHLLDADNQISGTSNEINELVRDLSKNTRSKQPLIKKINENAMRCF